MGRYALLVATGEYEDVRLSRLRAPEQDVERLAAVLEDPDVGGFTSVEVLRDRADHEIRRAVEEVLTARGPDDLVLLYFSCHGLTTPARRLYFAASNTVQDRPAGTAIPRSFLNEQLEDCRASGRVLVLDCCFSGAFVEGFKASADAAAAVLDDVGTGYVVMTASNAYEYAFEQDSLSLDAPLASLFTDVLIEGLTSGAADLDGDGWIDVNELFAYAQGEVRVRRPDQTPQFFAHGSSQPLRIARTGGAPGRRVRRTATYTSGQWLVARGFRAAAEPVCRTLGPLGRRAVVFVDRRPVELSDASAIVAAFQPDDPRDSLGAGYVRDLVEEVRRDAGDGAASAVAVARGAIGGLVEAMRDGHDPVRLRRGVLAAAVRAGELISEAAVPLELSAVPALATAAAGSAEIGDLVADVVRTTGWDGPVLVEETRGFGLEFEARRGLRLDVGYASGQFATDTTRGVAVLEDARVLLVGGRLTDVRDLVTRMDLGARSLFVVCERLPHAELAALLDMGSPGRIVAVTAEGEVLERLHGVVGGAIQYAVLAGEPWLKSSLGDAAKVVVTERDTVVFAAPGSRSGAGSGSGSGSGSRKGDDAALIRADAADVAKVERAVRAVHSAGREGVLRGGGLGLADIGVRLASEAAGTPEEAAGRQAFAAALAEPSRHIAENAALTVPDLDASLLDSAGVARTAVTAAARTAARFLLLA
ncbi:caspase, EACC1-associated type [Saccharothrix sp. NRRL B-16314]|uniref:caspase, EACC1-associated type n=1 Tax=Saccharothrix sp. NRRL B-16314 TaxID=1463825 RepID=UPI0006919B4D|nr:caspase family protein [Saccharothrix sp. NRRL B-16314]